MERLESTQHASTSPKQSAVNNLQAIEGESIFGAKASFGLQGLAAEDRITLRFRFGIPSADEL